MYKLKQRGNQHNGSTHKIEQELRKREAIKTNLMVAEKRRNKTWQTETAEAVCNDVN